MPDERARRLPVRFLFAFHVAFCLVLVFLLGSVEETPLYRDLAVRLPFFAPAVRWIFFFTLGLPLIALYLSYRETRMQVRGEENLYQLVIVSLLDNLLKDKEPAIEYHSKRVAEVARGLCGTIGLRHDETRVIVFAAMFHDIGKVFLDYKLLRTRKEALSADERKSYEDHPILGQRILENIHTYPGAGLLVRYHHEYWDGHGFPEGLGGAKIPLGARIISVADCFDAQVHGLDFQAPVPPETALAAIKERSGSQFDPAVVAAFERYLKYEWPREKAPADET